MPIATCTSSAGVRIPPSFLGDPHQLTYNTNMQVSHNKTQVKETTKAGNKTYTVNFLCENGCTGSLGYCFVQQSDDKCLAAFRRWFK